ncbi:MAG: MerR family transcriptional regulator [Planctomycetes bacterium]|nr:MerR family transcriptional regulator [Planctomycetota bacterium]
MRTTPTQPLENARWTLGELCALVEHALARDYAGPANGQVRAVPDARTVRYYTTLGLLDRPAEMRGRTAYYARRHLLQIVAIKRLQAQGLPLAAIQERLVGLTNAKLEDIAHLPAQLVEDLSAAAGGLRATDEGALVSVSPAQEAEASRRETLFWAAAPVPAPPPTEVSPVRAQGVDLSADAMLLLTDVRTLSNEDLEALRRAAAPILEVLRTRGLTKEGRAHGQPDAH